MPERIRERSQLPGMIVDWRMPCIFEFLGLTGAAVQVVLLGVYVIDAAQIGVGVAQGRKRSKAMLVQYALTGARVRVK